MDKEIKKVVRKDPKTILAFQWKNFYYPSLPEWVSSAIELDENGYKNTHTYGFELRSGEWIYDNYWAVREEDGEVHSYSNEDFEKLFSDAPKEYMSQPKE